MEDLLTSFDTVDTKLRPPLSTQPYPVLQYLARIYHYRGRKTPGVPAELRDALAQPNVKSENGIMFDLAVWTYSHVHHGNSEVDSARGKAVQVQNFEDLTRSRTPTLLIYVDAAYSTKTGRGAAGILMDFPTPNLSHKRSTWGLPW